MKQNANAWFELMVLAPHSEATETFSEYAPNEHEAIENFRSRGRRCKRVQIVRVRKVRDGLSA